MLKINHFLLIICASFLIACGGGGGSSATESGSNENEVLTFSFNIPGSVSTGQSVVLKANVAYNGTTKVFYKWGISEECGSLSDQTSETPLFAAIETKDNKLCPVSLSVTAGDLSMSNTAQIVILGYGAEDLLSVALDIPEKVQYSESIVLKADLTYTGTENVRYLWSMDPACGNLNNTESPAPLFTAANTADDMVCPVKVTVSAGNKSHSSTGNIVIKGSSSPSDPILSVNANVAAFVSSHQSVSWSASVHYTGLDPLSYEWSVSPLCGTLSKADTASPVFHAVNTTANINCTASVTVRAGSKSSIARSDFMVTASASENILSAGLNLPASVLSGTLAKFSADVTYTGPEPIEYNWSVSPSCGVLDNQASSQPVFTAVNTSIDLICSVSLTVSAGGLTTNPTGSFTVSKTGSESSIYVELEAPEKVPAGGYATFKVSVQNSASTPEYTWQISEGCGSFDSIRTTRPMFSALKVENLCEATITAKIGNSEYVKSASFEITADDVVESLEIIEIISPIYAVSGTNNNFSAEIAYIGTNNLLYYWQTAPDCGELMHPNNSSVSLTFVSNDTEKACTMTLQVSTKSGLKAVRAKEFTMLPLSPSNNYLARLHPSYDAVTSHVTMDFTQETVTWLNLGNSPSGALTAVLKDNYLTVTYDTGTANASAFIYAFHDGGGKGFFNRPAVTSNLTYYVDLLSSVYIMPSAQDETGYYNCLELLYRDSSGMVRRNLYSYGGYTCTNSPDYLTDPVILQPDSNRFFKTYEPMRFHASITDSFPDVSPVWTVDDSSTINFTVNFDNNTTNMGDSSAYLITDFKEADGEGFFGRPGKNADLTLFTIPSKEVYAVGSDPDSNGKFRCVTTYYYNKTDGSVKRALYEADSYGGCDWEELYQTYESGYGQLAPTYIHVLNTDMKTVNFKDVNPQWTAVNAVSADISVTNSSITAPNLPDGAATLQATTFKKGTGGGFFEREAIMDTLHYFVTTANNAVFYPSHQNADDVYQCITQYELNGNEVYRRIYAVPGFNGCTNTLYDTKYGFSALYSGIYEAKYYNYTSDFTAEIMFDTKSFTLETRPILSNLSSEGFDLLTVDPVHPGDYIEMHFPTFHYKDGTGFLGRAGSNVTYFLSDDGKAGIIPYDSDGKGKYRDLLLYFEYGDKVFSLFLRFPGAYHKNPERFPIKPY